MQSPLASTRGASRTPWIENAQILESHDKPFMSPIPHPQIQPTPHRVVVFIEKIPAHKWTCTCQTPAVRGCAVNAAVVFSVLLGNVYVPQILHC